LSEALVDQGIDPTQPDLAPDSSNGDDGVDCLRPLKGAPADAVARGGGEAPAAADGVANSAGNNAAWKERRQSPRLRCSGGAEFRTEANDLRI
jgi:hypothetical protein